MKKTTYIDRTHIIFTIILIVVVTISFGSNVVQFLQPKGRVSCADFGSYTDIPSDWKVTMPWLDREYHGESDSIPCDTLYERWVKYHK